ncbi:hypothetical protein ACEWY4_001769 [Coilia grayii]|uniref:Sushi domain-containing protein n=1 Tax=Coilia grayii TaxID=363190 RepID=A0ABD1KUH9_9TELE
MILKSLLLLLIVHKLSVTKAEDKSGGCGPPPLVNHTVPIEGQSFPEKKSLRYSCEPGFLRKAGTSSLIRCIKAGEQYVWQIPLQLICIPDPRLPAVSKRQERTPNPIKASTKSPLAIIENTTTTTTATVHSSATPKPQQFNSEQAVVSGSVVGVALCALMLGVLFFLYTKEMLPCWQRRRSPRDEQESVPMATPQPNSGTA